MDVTIEVFRRFEQLTPMYGGENTIKYMPVMNIMCSWQRNKPTELVGGSNEPTKYIENIKATIPYNPIITCEDYFIKRNNKKYKIINILNIDDNNDTLELYLTEWGNDGEES